ncbi:MAG: DoxX family protein [Cyclobacteriaceae bacterium]|jgi:putative oxidoreductase|nr:DoxX family protein [Flammeovirgaceae bacterium]MCZ8071887.1 DoxX family protein [Cytophagales bacterium]
MEIGSKVKLLMKNFLSAKPWSFDAGVLLVRICCALMLLHGWSKFVHFAEDSKEWPDPFHVGSTFSYSLTVFAELFCTIFLVFGLFTRMALVPLIILMLVIVFIIHGEDPFADREHALMYLLSYFALLITGPGKYSLDSLIQKK